MNEQNFLEEGRIAQGTNLTQCCFREVPHITVRLLMLVPGTQGCPIFDTLLRISQYFSESSGENSTTTALGWSMPTISGKTHKIQNVRKGIYSLLTPLYRILINIYIYISISVKNCHWETTMVQELYEFCKLYQVIDIARPFSSSFFHDCKERQVNDNCGD